MNATYTKLKDGNWGLRIQGVTDNLHVNAVTVTKKSGEVKTEHVDRIVWRGNGIMLATIAREPRRMSRLDREDQECELCGKNKYTCGHCIGW